MSCPALFTRHSSLLFLLVASAAVLCRATHANNVTACVNTLDPFSVISNSTWTKCVAEQSGLQAIIQGLDVSQIMAIIGGIVPMDFQSLIYLLEDNGYHTQATKLRKCIARENNQTTTSGEFNMTALQQAISAAVSGLSINSSVQLGIQNCGPVANFQVPEYIYCLLGYCTHNEGSFNPVFLLPDIINHNTTLLLNNEFVF